MALVTANVNNTVFVLINNEGTWNVLTSITMNIGSEPTGVAITPDGTMALVTNIDSNSVSVLVKEGENEDK
jgi:DNA-binding beta-propeller fold protein YncE